jgi:hypothetical protein
MEQAILHQNIGAKILSCTPGRLRLKIAPCVHQAKKMQNMANFLAAHPHVSSVTTNFYSGTMVIYHDDLAEVLATLRNVAIIFLDITQGSTDAATNISSTIVDLNQKVQLSTGGAVDLRFLFPLGLSLLAVRQLIVKGLQLDVIPWYVLAWYSFDSFVKFNINLKQVQRLPNQASAISNY